MTRIIIDPITRIEGHLKIECEITNNVVTDAWSSGTLFRGIEKILTGRAPDDAWLFTQRVCGVCTYVHGVCSVRCVENASGAAIPADARVVRNLLMGGQFVHDHPVHFYHLHGFDWVDVVSALDADVAATEALARRLSPNAPTMDFAAAKARLQQIFAGGQLGLFDGGYWGHPAMKLTPEENLLVVTHYLYALQMQVKAANMHAIFGAKNPHLQSLRVGGVTCSRDITTARIAEFRAYLTEQRNYIDTVYLPDAGYMASKYSQESAGAWARVGGSRSYLAYGEFPLGDSEPADLFLPQGVLLDRETTVKPLDVSSVVEHVKHSWYQGTALAPSAGQTNPAYTGYNTEDRYSWLKAPRYNGQPMEVGPLARVLVAYGRGHRVIRPLVDSFLSESGLTLAALHSTLGRVAARAIETKVVADAMDGWLNQLRVGATVRVEVALPTSAQGHALNEAPRGALGHWIDISDQKIANYQMVVPSTWNFGPRCLSDKRGPVEEALIGTLVADPSKPLEILRTVHSFDPCIACAVHAFDTRTGKRYEVRAL
jgi:[NiFe] hydrogenase large subunit